MKHRSTFQLHTAVMQLAAVLLILVLISTCLVSGRFARYVSADSHNASARIAAYVFHVEDTETHFLDISTITKPGDEISYHFTVTNKNGSVISEVNEEFFLNIELWGSLPLVVTVTGSDNLSLTAGEIPVSETGKTHTYQAAVQGKQDYILTVKWPDEKNDISYSRAGLSQLVLTINAQQID